MVVLTRLVFANSHFSALWIMGVRWEAVVMQGLEEEHRCVAESACANWSNGVSHERVCVDSTALTINISTFHI